MLDAATAQLLREEEEELTERLRLNPNAFLPLEGVEDRDQQAKDEEQIRELARFLWNDLLPAFVEQVKQGDTSAVDGDMLTETMHSMGINMRYLGRLASLAQAPGQEGAGAGSSSADDASAAAKGGAAGSMARRFRAPDHLVQLCEAEMAARAAKHVVYDLLKDRGDLRAAPGPTVVAVLNAVLGGCGAPAAGAPEAGAAAGKRRGKGSGAAAAAETESAPTSPREPSSNGGGGKKKGKKGKNGGAHAGAAASASLPAHAQPRVAPPPAAGKSVEELKALVLEDIKLRYRYASPTLLAHHASASASAQAAASSPSARWAVPNPNALLRRLCQKLGLRVAARAYDWASAEPVALGDIVDVFPVAKHTVAAQPGEQAKGMLDTARLLARQGAVNHAFELAQDAAALYTQVWLVGGAGLLVGWLVNWLLVGWLVG